MANIGQLGDVSFTVSDEEVLTFSNLSKTHAGKWSEIEYVNRRNKMQFNGAGLIEGTFDMTLSKSLGVDPDKARATLEGYADNGDHIGFALGGVPMFGGDVVVTSVEESFTNISGTGKVLDVGLTVSIKEYGDD